MIADVQVVASLLAAGGFGGIVVSSISGARERRQLRGRMLTALTAVEAARWEYRDPEQDGNIAPERAELESLALMARVPRELTDAYTGLAQVAAWCYSEDLAVSHHRLEASTPPALERAVQLASDTLVAHLWHPMASRPRVWLRLRSLRRLVSQEHLKGASWATGPYLDRTGLLEPRGWAGRAFTPTGRSPKPDSAPPALSSGRVDDHDEGAGSGSATIE